MNEELIRMDKELNLRYETLVEQYKKSRNITEELKEQDQMRWVQGMNNIRVMVEEMLINEIMTI
ncbi:TnpV protein [Holdemanella sp. DFI.5.21]|nr:TnpV protein [Holdemanella sp. DFI.5.21]